MSIFKRKKVDTGRRFSTHNGDRKAVFSYYKQSGSSESRSRLPTEQRRLRPSMSINLGSTQNNLIKNLPLIIMVVITAACLIYNTTLSQHAQIITDTVSSTDEKLLRNKSAYQEAIKQEFASSLLNRSKLTIDTQSIADNLSDRFPELADISITLPLLGTRPVVHLEATKPALALSSGDQAYIVDNRGVVIMDAKDMKSGENLVTVIDESGLLIEQGKPALSVEQVKFIEEINHQFNSRKMPIRQIVLPTAANQLNVYLKDTDYYGKFLFGTDGRVAAGSFMALVKDLKAKNQKPKSYIDVRIEGRAYYR